MVVSMFVGVTVSAYEKNTMCCKGELSIYSRMDI